jgi:adenylylsulfate kinase-like enzyme
MRSLAKEIIGSKDFYEIFINTSLEDCEKRDTKGLI